MLLDFAHIAVFALVGVAIVGAMLIVGKLFRPDHPYPEKLTTYECGEQVIGSPWARFNIRFYIFALLFLIFEVEFVLMFPPLLVFRRWVMAGTTQGLFAFVEIGIFSLILVLALAYVWRKGDLEWVKTVRNEKADLA